MFTGNASPTWKAVEHGLELVKRGAIWRVGNGTSIRIWRDNWFCREPSLRPLGKKNLSRLKWVSELLDQRTCSWDMNLIKHIFYPIDADIIAKMKKPQASVDDYVAWHYEKSGIYIIA